MGWGEEAPLARFCARHVVLACSGCHPSSACLWEATTDVLHHPSFSFLTIECLVVIFIISLFIKCMLT